MKKILILRTERCGSNFLVSLLLGSTGRYENLFHGILDKEEDLYLKTIPPKQCRVYNNPKGSHIQIIDIREFLLTRLSVNIPELYFFVPPVETLKCFYDSLPGNEWLFVYLLRDPRNHISSLFTRALGCRIPENPLSQKDREFFSTLCSSYGSSECRSVYNMLSDQRYYLLRFEKLVKETFNTLQDLFDFLGFQIDSDFYNNFLVDAIDEDVIGSSFGDKGKYSNKRYYKWTKEQHDIFNSIASPEYYKLFKYNSTKHIGGIKY